MKFTKFIYTIFYYFIFIIRYNIFIILKLRTDAFSVHSVLCLPVKLVGPIRMAPISSLSNATENLMFLFKIWGMCQYQKREWNVKYPNFT